MTEARAKVRAVVAALVALAASAPRSARAQSADDTLRAEQLFREATVLTHRGEYAEACPKLAESQRLDAALGTQFNLALCYEKIGRLGSAWRNLRAVARLARAAGKVGREEIAQRMLVDLRPRVARFVFATHEPVRVAVDGEPVDPEELTFYAVDPGDHVVEATAPAKKPWQARLGVPSNPGAEVRVDVPPLAAEEGRVVTLTREVSNGRRTAGFALAAAGVVGLGVAVTTGVLILEDRALADDRCRGGCVDQEGRDAVARGETLLPINGVAWAVGLLGLGAGGYLVLTSSAKRASAARVGAYGAGLSITGNF